MMLIAKWEAGGNYFYAVGSYRAFGESMWSSKSHAAICVLAISVKLHLSWMLGRLFIQFPHWLVNTGKIMLDGFDGQKLAILTCNWLVLGWGPRMLKAVFGHHRHIWEFPGNLRELGFPQTPWEFQRVFCFNVFAGLILVLLKCWSWILALIPVSYSPSLHLHFLPSATSTSLFWGCGRGGCPH